MASGHAYRVNRPNTWLLRPMLQSVLGVPFFPAADCLHGWVQTCCMGYAPAVTVPSMRLNKHRHRRNTSDRIYQPDSQDGRKRAKGDDSNFEMKILIQATGLRSLSGVSPWPLANRKNPAALGGDRRADPPITPLQWLTG